MTAHDGNPITYVIFQSKSGKKFSIRVRLKRKNQSPVEKLKSRFDRSGFSISIAIPITMKNLSAGFDENPGNGLRYKIPHGGGSPYPPPTIFPEGDNPPTCMGGEVGGTTPLSSGPNQPPYPILGMRDAGALRRELHTNPYPGRCATVYVTHSWVGGWGYHPPHCQKIRGG
jgi:hypothetical protein